MNEWWREAGQAVCVACWIWVAAWVQRQAWMEMNHCLAVVVVRHHDCWWCCMIECVWWLGACVCGRCSVNKHVI